PSPHSATSAVEGGCTLRTTSLRPKTSAGVATRPAPAAPYASSGNAAAVPAPCSTTTSRPVFTSRPAVSGTSATRRSLAAVSLGTPILIPLSSEVFGAVVNDPSVASEWTVDGHRSHHSH